MSNSYEEAKKLYAGIGIDTEAAIKALEGVSLSMHCWQGDDVGGFEGETTLSGGIQATGNYPGKARNPEELMADIDKVLSVVAGKHRINIHASYAFYDGEKVERDKLEPRHFDKWIEFAKERGLGIDINPTFFSHPMADSGLTLSSPDEKVRRFWTDHAKAVRKAGAYIGEKLGTPCLCNTWIPDGYKETPADRTGPRKRLKESLDEIYSVKYDKKYLVDAVESKVFGIGVESYTVGSHEFYMNYAAKNDIYCLLDNGHYHPTESVADKIPSLLLFSDKVALHVTRGVRWDSDHVVAYTDELKEIAKEIVLAGTDRVIIGLDYFDASVNRVAAWVIGMRNMQKALLTAMLTPHAQLGKFQDDGNFTEMFAYSEEYKTYPVGAVWDEFCERNGVPVRNEWIDIIRDYEKKVLAKRK